MNEVTITCQYCGKTKNLPYRYRDQKYCSNLCANRGRAHFVVGEFDESLEWKKGADRKWQCPYQPFVGCSFRRCNKCGWNPEVAKARTEAFMARFENGD